MQIKSITRFLIISVFLSIIITTTGTLAWSYHTIANNTAKFFDVLLIESAEKIKIFLRGDLSNEKIKQIQAELDECSHRKKCIIDPILHATSDFKDSQSQWTKRFTERYRSESIFQIWELEPEELILYSKHAPSEDFAEFVPGFQTVEYKNYNWRVYTQIDPQLNLAIQTAQRYDLRHDLANMIIQENIYPIAIFTPILLILTFIAIKIMSEVFDHISHAIKRRDPKKLDLLSLNNIPKEIRPLVDELNRLFTLINHGFEREQRFNSDAAHELKTPLAIIKSQSELAQMEIEKFKAENAKNPENLESQRLSVITQNLSNITKGIDRANHMVSQLLILSRLSPNTSLENVENCYLDKICREVIADSINHIDNKNIKISLDLLFNSVRSTVPAIQGNKILLSLLIRNIIDNAVRYGGAENNVKVNIITTQDFLILQINDTGPGLSDKLKQRVFDRFYRQTGTNTEGSGLGLSIVKLIADLHDAKINLKDNSEAVSGLCFEVIFKLL